MTFSEFWEAWKSKHPGDDTLDSLNLAAAAYTAGLEQGFASAKAAIFGGKE